MVTLLLPRNKQPWAKVIILADSHSRKTPKWMKRLQIIDSTTITLFSNLLFKGAGRHPKTGKKCGIKVHTVIHANEGVPSDIKFTSAATNNSFMLKPTTVKSIAEQYLLASVNFYRTAIIFYQSNMFTDILRPYYLERKNGNKDILIAAYVMAY